MRLNSGVVWWLRVANGCLQMVLVVPVHMVRLAKTHRNVDNNILNTLAQMLGV